MKKLHFFIIKAYLRPFATTFLIVLFILMMLFLFKYIDEFVGKGVDWFTVAELIFYANASNVPLALPLAILLSSIMTFGSMGENYELVAIKASGISLTRAMLPLLLIMTVLCLTTFYFANIVIPQANLKIASTIYEFRQTKPSFLIKEGVFYDGIDGYSIKVEKKDEETQTLHGIILYDHTKGNGNTTVLKAEEGEMYKSADEQYLILKLKNGVRYEEMRGERNRNQRERLVRVKFEEHEQKFLLTGFSVADIDEDLFKNNFQMQNISQLEYSADSLNEKRRQELKRLATDIAPYYIYSRDSLFAKYEPLEFDFKDPDFLRNIDENDRELVLHSALGYMRNVKSNTSPAATQNAAAFKLVKRHWVEFHRKFTLSVACFVLFFIGAPLGAIIRKGGLGLPVIVAIVFFLVFHITSTIGEKAAREGSWTPYAGMWLSTAVLIPLGIFLTYKATSDSSLFDLENYIRFFRKLNPWRKKAVLPKKETPGPL
ncbi:lipopolysaccharide export system permease protein [Anseongella ginsenosidimutans]|uniref:Lipopolysaccharide export system permease protein n=1 Tax=Anseongella ginsenosidimutans TaxID=496056 RepID=A0A4R3KXU3_9SPHI|nr:LptF/LptG family permease [Anseongella ginsenosidimutans]QEC51098.1 YjgP/YjgQ family permease [Anseongella ginsenosidimutans]TCS90241.1 lipopolysaccharide export system permease protein [Anseongella ginsenosidimutans]